MAVKGQFHEVKGKVKEKVGRATNNPDLEDEGTGEKIARNVQKESWPGEESIRKATGNPRPVSRIPPQKHQRLRIAKWTKLARRRYED